MRKVRYLVGRLNVSGTYQTDEFEEKLQFILRRFQDGNTVDDGQFRYRFMGVRSVIDVDETHRRYIGGLLVKYKPDGDVRQIDEESGAQVEYPVPNKFTAASDFLLEVRHGLIAYHPVTNRISPDQFRRNFCKILEEAIDDLPMMAVIGPLPYREEVIHELRSFDEVTSVRTTLYPSNPNFRSLWKDVDERVKDAGASKYSESFTVDGDPGEESLNVGDGSPVVASVAMASDGYGKATIKGFKDGVHEEYRTETDTREVKAPRLIQMDEEPDSEALSGDDPNAPQLVHEEQALAELLSRLDEIFVTLRDDECLEGGIDTTDEEDLHVGEYEG